MFKLSKMTVRVGLVVFAVLAMILANSLAPTPALAATAPTLGAAASYSVLAGTTVTNTDSPTTVNLNVGVSPGSAVVGFPPGTVGPPGAIHAADAHASLAQVASSATFDFLDQPSDHTYAGVTNLTLLSPLGPGVYEAPAGFILTGNLNLTGSGVWIFKSGSSLITSPGASVTGGDPCNVWWRVGSSATLDTNTQFIGNILAYASIGLMNGASLTGRALAQTGAVTLDNNVISTFPCGGSTGPHLSLTKSVTPATYNVGDSLTYTLIATNDGNTTLTNVLISDPGLNITGSNPAQGSALIPGATMTLTGTRTGTDGSLTNTATASATGAPDSAPASVTAFEKQSGPHLSLTKTVSPSVFSQVGEVLYYTLIATNDGDVDLSGVSISDPGITNVVSNPAQPADLAPGATLTVMGSYIITQSDLTAGYFNNAASTTGTPQEGEAVSANATEEASRAPSVGGEDGPINKASILAPWLVSGLVILLGVSVLTALLLRRRTSR